MKKELLEVALSYANHGWLVFPLHSIHADGRCSCGKVNCDNAGKHPRTTRGFKDASTNELQIHQWWSQWPDANIGIRTGKESGLVVLDIDPRNGGHYTLEDLETNHGKLPKTVESKTGGNGRHIFLSHPGEHTQSKKGALGSGLDIKADGGYIVAPPSSHISGETYEWEISSHPDSIPLAPMPDWLFKKIQEVPTNTRQKNTPGWVTDTFKELQEGNRNDTFCKITGKLYHGGFEDHEIVALLSSHAADAGFPISELENEVQGICRRYPRNSISPQPIHRDGKVENLSIVQLSNVPEPGPRIDLVENFIPEKQSVLLYGDGGQGKSYLGLFLATCIVTGRPFAGLSTKQTNVLYLDWEMDQDEHARRAHRVARGMGLPKPPGGFYYYRAHHTVNELVSPLKNLITEKEIGFVILDSFGAACSGDSEQARFVIPLLSNLRTLDTTILILDHQSKLQEGQHYSKKPPFGSTYKFNLARSVIQTERVNSVPGQLSLFLRHKKFNMGALGDKIPVRILFESNSVRLEKADMQSDAAFAEHLNAEEKVEQSLRDDGPGTCKEIADRIGLEKGTVGNAIRKLKTNKGNVISPRKKGRAPIYAVKGNCNEQ